jgi:hypothetical protein
VPCAEENDINTCCVKRNGAGICYRVQRNRDKRVPCAEENDINTCRVKRNGAGICYRGLRNRGEK